MEKLIALGKRFAENLPVPAAEKATAKSDAVCESVANPSRVVRAGTVAAESFSELEKQEKEARRQRKLEVGSPTDIHRKWRHVSRHCNSMSTM